ncbi:LANO_0G10308g1_1 [Lachancea nothofagi CBS 11611]|uniref:LANO_0G10308g1_1 n=1 Tax=Lachancea nothofagi CBS 11611 TaxID=1266666 RepID=A0A1G4KIY1_9SACH|nr:LANO_0G10308g1_1 [Lachancea nothofagi CBS 11611]
MSFQLSPTEEHYLKRELLKQELSREIQCLNDAHALRKFGYPFSPEDPRSIHSDKKLIQRLKSTKSNTADAHADIGNSQDTDYPLLNHFLQNFVMKMPLLSQNLIEKEDFWQQKVQVFFEHFMQLQFSSSFDREELTKRRKLSMKLSKIVLLMYNSGIGCAQEPQYFELDKFKFKDGKEQNYKSDKLDKFVMPTKESLKYLLTEEPYFINGWDFNVMAVATYEALHPKPESDAKVKLPSSSTSSSASNWMKSAFAFAPSSLSSPSKLFSKMTLSDQSTGNHGYHFIARVRQENSNDNWYIAKTYSDFKRLVSNLNKEFPGKELPKLPHSSKVGVSTTTAAGEASNDAIPSTPKERIISRFDVESAATNDASSAVDSIENTQDNDEFDEFEDASDKVTRHLPREKLRTSLRQFLRSLTEDSEVAKSVSMLKFVSTAKIEFDSLPTSVIQDMKGREAVDIENLENQVAFQKMAFEQTVDLQEAMKEFKTSILRDDQYLINLFREIKEKDSIEELSPTLKIFMGWCRINLSATIYTTFLGKDGGYELFTQVKRLHKLLPYTMMIQILKITNPMAIMKGMMDLFMARPFGGNSLLQSMFSSVLSDDLKSQFKLAREIEDAIATESKFGVEIARVLSTAIFENEDGKFVDMEDVHEEATGMSMPLSLVLVMKCCEIGHISQDALGELIESYAQWKNRKDSKEQELSKVDSATSITDVPGLYFSHVKGLLQIYIRERDKRLMKQVWQDPELSQLLKSMITLFYEPLVRIFRVSRMDVAFRNFEKFMTDLVALLDNVINGQASSSTSFNVVDAISKIVEKHENSLFQFIHDICSHDTENTFEGMINYLTSIVKFLQESKYGECDRIDLVHLVNQCSQNGLDASRLKKQLQDLVSSKEAARQLYQTIVESKTSKSSKKKLNVKEAMDEKWQQSNDAAMPHAAAEIGLQDGDLVDLDLDVGDFEFLEDENEEALHREYQEVLQKDLDVSEISKMTDLIFKDKLREVLKL